MKDGFTGGAAERLETALKSVKKPILLSPIKGGDVMYHSGNSELEQLEDRHYRFNQKLSELEWDYADMRMDVRQHTENLVDWLSALHFQAPSAEAQSGLERLFALQEEFEAELKRYEERLEEEREREQQEYYKQRQQLEQGD